MRRSSQIVPSSALINLLRGGGMLRCVRGDRSYSSSTSSSSQQNDKTYETVKTETMDASSSSSSSSSTSSSRWSDMFEQNTPVLIKGLVSTWPAVSSEEYRWVNGRRFEEVDKGCFVPVEIGRHYMDSSLNIAHMEFGEVASYLLADDTDTDNSDNMGKNDKNDRKGGKSDGRSGVKGERGGTSGKKKEQKKEDLSANYMSRTFLAQYAVSEIPTLEADVKPFPDLIKTGKGHLYRSNIWFGGAEGTEDLVSMHDSHHYARRVLLTVTPPITCCSESPCHRDPFHNILCQVFGHKTVILFPPSEEANLYLASGTVQQNTSLVDLAAPDYAKHPLFLGARGYSCTLEPGDGLYIPKGFFHYCYTSQKSCSVNFWWL